MVEALRELDHAKTQSIYLDEYDLAVEISDHRDPKANSDYHGPLGFQVVVKSVFPNDFGRKNFLSGLFETISERITGNLLLETQSRHGKDTPESTVAALLLPKYKVKEYGYSSEEKKIFANFTKEERKTKGMVSSG